MTTYFDGDTFERNGRTFKIQIEADTDACAPWENSDGHGVVSEWETRGKKPSERVLNSDRSLKRYYDFAESVRIAKRDGWGLGNDALAKLESRLGRKATQNEIVAESVERDFEFLRGWCNDEWHYVGVIVTLLDDEDEETSESDAIWGIEDSADEYIAETAQGMADEICRRMDEEDAERAEWNARDVMTKGE